MRRAQPRQSLTGRRVLIVEDEFFVADDLAQAVAQLGGEIVGPVPTCEEALILLSTAERIDIAVLDINFEPYRVSRRRFGLGQAAKADASSWV
jgi:DNA-binding LytR/AlgR family response regulator